jgi:hypothetical protein
MTESYRILPQKKTVPDTVSLSSFCGGVDRGTISDWKCRREKDVLVDRFVCRAVD